MEKILPLLRCPETKTPLHCSSDSRVAAAELISEKGIRYPVIGGIPRLLKPTKTREEEMLREKIQKFYEVFTFPGYDDIDSPGVLMDKAKKSAFGQWVDQAIPPMASVLEVGCGTGQMTNFLGLVPTRTVVGVDQSIASLNLGEQFRSRFGMANIAFVQGNIFEMPITENAFDVVICSGVLHHTPDPKGGFLELLKLVKPGGKILIGLYNTYARIPLGIRKAIFRTTGSTFRFLDAHMRRRDVDASKKEIWFQDQYRNPHESWHSVDEVLGWFAEAHVKFLSSVPAIGPSLMGEESGLRLFEEHPRGTALQHVIKQLGWMFTIGREGGLFVLVGEKGSNP